MRRVITAALVLTLATGAAFASGSCGPSSPTPTPTPTATATPGSCQPTAGAVCFGTQSFVEFVAGDFPVVISVPHGGAVAPSSIPDRTGTTVTDSNTIELGRAIAQAFSTRIGRRPHVILAHLRRTKLDANRDVTDGAQGNADATKAWNEYHGFVDLAISTAASGSSRGLYIDLHGHGHPIQRLELGYLLSGDDLNLSNTELNGGGHASSSSLRLAMPLVSVSFADLLRGPTSLGGLLGSTTPSVPSPAAPTPATEPYFNGGFSTERYSARLPGLQIEANFSGVRDTAGNRTAFADRLVTALVTFLDTHLGVK